MNFIRIWLYLTIITAIMISSPLLADDYSDRLQFADGLYTRKMYDLAGVEYAGIIKNFPTGNKNDAAMFRLAESLRQQGKSAEAARLYSKIIVNYKGSEFRLRAAYRRARLYMDAGDFESAAAYFGVILAENPPEDLSAAALYYLGESLLETKAYDKADKTFEKVVSQYSGSMFYTHALMHRGDIYRDRWIKSQENNSGGSDQLAEKSLKFFKQALERKVSDRIAAEALFQIAEIRFRQHKFEQSSDYYHQLMTKFPKDERSATARMQAAWSAGNAGLHAEALKLADQALADSSVVKSKDEWLYIKANSLRQLMQNSAAAETYLKLLAEYPESRFALPSRYEIAVAYFKMGKYSDAILHAEQIRITPELRSDVCWLLAEANAAINKGAESIQYYRMVIRDSADTPRARDALYRLAHQLQNQGAYREAAQSYSKLVSEFPKSDLAPQALYASAFSLEKVEAYDEAARNWRKLVTDYPHHELVQEAIYRKAMCEIRLERKDDATASLDELLRRFPDNRFSADAYYWKGMLLYEMQKYESAESALRSAMQKSSREDLKNDAAFQLGLVLQKLNRRQDAANLFQQLLDSPQNSKFSPELLEWLSTYYDAQKQYGKAAKAAELLVKLAAEPAWKQAGWTLLGRAKDKLNNKKEAQAAYIHALESSVNTRYASEACLRLGNIALNQKDSAGAVTYFKLAVNKVNPQNEIYVKSRAFFGLGLAADLGGNKVDAARYYMSVAILYNDNEIVPECLYRAAVAYDGLGRKDDRNKASRELIKRYPKSSWAGKVDKSWQK
jgi:TolA-binding protein